MRSLILFIFLIIAISGCNKKEFCIVPSEMTMGMNFKTYDSTNTLVDTFLVNPSVYSIDTFYDYANNKATLNAVQVALNRKLSQQAFVILQSTLRDTIVVTYTGEENFISNGCGYQTYFQLQRVSHSRNSIDSVNILNATINPSFLKDHLEVIYK